MLISTKQERYKIFKDRNEDLQLNINELALVQGSRYLRVYIDSCLD